MTNYHQKKKIQPVVTIDEHQEEACIKDMPLTSKNKLSVPQNQREHYISSDHQMSRYKARLVGNKLIFIERNIV